MKLLIITQKVDENDDVLGFFVRWIDEFSKHVEKITVVCLQKGTYRLPDNVTVLSLGKEERKGRMTYLIRFFGAIWKERREYDAVFVHMNPIYVVLGGIFWKFWHKKIALWYTHKRVDLKLRIAEKLSDIIFTASKESFRFKSGKVRVVGHGIDPEKFKNKKPKAKHTDQQTKLIIITAGRISLIKNIHVLIKVAELLKEKGLVFEMNIAGKPATEADKVYFETLKKQVIEKKLEDQVFFVGPIQYSEIEKFYWKGGLFVNLSETGSLDKAVLEAAASGLPVLTSNEAFFDILPEHNIIRTCDAVYIARRISAVATSNKDEYLATDIVNSHSLESVIQKIISLLE